MTKKLESNSQILNLFLMFHFNMDVILLAEVALCNGNMEDTKHVLIQKVNIPIFQIY